jgi:PAS domain S-box-containing protein
MRIILFIFVLLSLLNAKELQKVTLQLQWKHQFEFAGFYMAKEKGFYEQAGLDVSFKEYENGIDITEEVLRGRADYATSYSSIVLDYLHNKPIVLLANFFKQSPLVLVTNKSIKTPKDLKGKKVMGLLDSIHNKTLLAMLEKFDLSPKDFTNVERSFAVDSFINGEVDALSAFTTNEIYILNSRGVSYNILDPAVFGIKFYDINLFTSQSRLQRDPEGVEAFREASIKGWEYALRNKKEAAQIILEKYNSQNKSLEALLFEAKQIEYLMLSNVYPIGSIDPVMIRTISDSYRQSQSINPNKDIAGFIYTPPSNIKLKPEQSRYLLEKRTIKMCVDPDWMPLEKVKDGKYLGIASDYMKMIETRIQTPIELVVTSSWKESLQKAKSRECDILSLAEETPSRKTYMDFTTPYISTPLVIVTKKGVPYIDSFESILPKKIGIVADYAKKELLEQKYKDIHLVEVDSVKDGLMQVEKNKIFGFIDNPIVLNDTLKREHFHDLSISGQFQESMELGIATRNDEKILGEIMQDAVESIDKQELKSIIQKYNNISYEIQTDYKTLFIIVLFGLVILSIFIYWNLKLKDEIKKKESAQEKLRESEEKFRILFDEAPVLLDAFDEHGKVVLWNKECEKVFGWSFDELQKTDDTLSLFYPDAHQRQRVLESFKNPKYNLFEEWSPITKSGKILSTMWANIQLPNGEVYNIGYDITQQRKDEQIIRQKTQQLQKAKEQLEELNNTLEKRVQDEIEKNTQQQMVLMHQSKLVQMGEMIENIAHQWRQPLAQINSSVLVLDTYLMENGLDDSRVEEKLAQIESLTAYMSKTIDDFKNFFHPDKSRTHFRLKDAIDNSYDILKGRFQTLSIEASFYIPDALELDSYIYELQQVVLTILNNSIDAFEMKKIKQPQIVIKAEDIGENILLMIEDNACGIDEKILNKIFEPYFTTKHKSQGTGLGLYMAKMIIESGFGGSLNVINKKGGACFTIEIPKGE